MANYVIVKIWTVAYLVNKVLKSKKPTQWIPYALFTLLTTFSVFSVAVYLLIGADESNFVKGLLFSLPALF